MQNRETVEQVLERSPLIAEAIDLDMRVRSLIVKASREACYDDRWQTYENLKHEAETVVGYGASNAALKSSVFYDAFIDAIDALLPQHENDFVILVPRTDAPQEKEQTA